MHYSHKVFIAGGKSSGVFDSVVWHLSNGAELIDSQGGDRQIVYILKRAVERYSIKEIKQGKGVVGWEVITVNIWGDASTSTEFEFKDDAEKYIADQQAKTWDCPVEAKMPDATLIQRLRDNIEQWKYHATGEDRYKEGLDNGLKYALEEVDKLFPPDDNADQR